MSNVNLTLDCVEKAKQKTSNLLKHLLKQRGGMQPVEAYPSNKPVASSEGDCLIVDSSRQQGKCGTELCGGWNVLYHHD